MDNTDYVEKLEKELAILESKQKQNNEVIEKVERQINEVENSQGTKKTYINYFDDDKIIKEEIPYNQNKHGAPLNIFLSLSCDIFYKRRIDYTKSISNLTKRIAICSIPCYRLALNKGYLKEILDSKELKYKFCFITRGSKQFKQWQRDLDQANLFLPPYENLEKDKMLCDKKNGTYKPLTKVNIKSYVSRKNH